MAERPSIRASGATFGGSPRLTDEDLRALGFPEPERVREGWARLRVRPDAGAVFAGEPGALLNALGRTCDPGRAFAGLERWLEAGGATAAPGWHEGPFLSLLTLLFAATPALAGYFIRWPQRTQPVLQPVLNRATPVGRAWRDSVQAAVSAAGTHEARLASLRRARTEGTLQIAALDLSDAAELEGVVCALSDLADAVTESALGCAVARLTPQFGTLSPPGSAPPFVVFALGKLGGRELNYSSDIDLVFAFQGEGRTQGGERAVECAEYFRRVAAEVLAALDQVTSDGRAYRVDVRLRPHGSAGALALSSGETLAYLQSEGRTWERQAWMKARPIAGALGIGHALLVEAQPFVYSHYLSLDAIGDIQALKRQIEGHVARRGETEEEVKLGRGGIRDIEFTIQFLQLMYGGDHPRIRGGNTLAALRALRGEGLLTQVEAEQLERAYVFWRRAEHRLQLHGDLQVHKLPSEPAARLRLAKSLRFPDLESFEELRQRHMAEVHETFERLFTNVFRNLAGPESELAELLLAARPDLSAVAKLLPAFGLGATDDNAKELVELGQEGLVLGSPDRTRRFFASLAPQLLRVLAATGEPEGALRRFSRIAGSLGGKAVFYQALHENEWLLKMTVELAAWSEYLTGILVANPGLFDEVVEALRTRQSKGPERMEAELGQLATGGDVADTLRAYRAGELLRIGVRDLFNAAPLEQTQEELTALAVAVLRAQFAHTLRCFSARRGSVETEDGRPVGCAVLGVGKLGGGEMNYGSDLDVLFFYGEEGSTSGGFPATPYFSELAQELTRAMAQHTGLGTLYTLDARLRPNGSKGPLASSLAAFERYWKEGALCDWERLALTRARFLAGDAGVGERAEHLVRSAVYSPLHTGTLATEVRTMRGKLEETAEEDDLKRGRGALVDIEFLAQYLQILHGPAFPPLRQTNTQAALRALVRFGKLDDRQGHVLLSAYAFFSRMANRVRIVHGLSANRLPQKPEELQKLALRAGYTDSGGRTAGAALREEYQGHAQAVRDLFDKLVV